MEKYLESTKLFKALGDPKRTMIVDMLSCGELCACEILEKFEMAHSTLSHHMKVLCECELVNARCQGKWTYYSLNLDTVEQTKTFFGSITSSKDDCICKQTSNHCKECGQCE